MFTDNRILRKRGPDFASQLDTDFASQLDTDLASQREPDLSVSEYTDWILVGLGKVRK